MRRLLVILSFSLVATTAYAQTPGCVDGQLLLPRDYFTSLTVGKIANPSALMAINADLNKMDWGQQISLTGGPRGRIFVPSPRCPNAAPRNPDEARLGVNQDPACWESYVDVADYPTGRWDWSEHFAAGYLPVSCGVVPQPTPVPVPTPTPQPQPIPTTALEQQVAALRADVMGLKEDVSELRHVEDDTNKEIKEHRAFWKPFAEVAVKYGIPAFVGILTGAKVSN